MLFDPFEEQFDVPASAVQLGDYVCGKSEVVGEKHQPFFPLGIPVADAAESGGIPFGGIEPAQSDGLIALHPAALVDRMRNETSKAEVFAGAGDEEGAMQGPAIQAFEVEVTTIHHVESTGFWNELIEHVDVMHSCRRDAQENRNSSAQVQQRVQFQSMLLGGEVGPRKQRHAQIDGSGI